MSLNQKTTGTGFDHAAFDEEADFLTPKEFEQESMALLEEARKRVWLSGNARQIVARIPVSVFAMGSL